MRGALLISAGVVLLDQIAKWAAVKYLMQHAEIALAPFLSFTLVFNRGAAFGFLNDAAGWQNLFFVGVASIACGVIIYLLWRLERDNRIAATALALILGGAAGNLVDRLLHGYVIDFIDVYYRTWHWPAFNVADSAITIGAFLLVFDTLRPGSGKQRVAS
ncbi:MAG: signal peptidase II [Sulfurifustaceae bacterium]